MQRWWLVGAGVVGIGLAVLFIPRPETGGEVADQDLSVEPHDPWTPPPEDDWEPGADGEAAPSTTGSGDAAAPRAEATADKPRLSPAARKVAEIRDTPEARTATRVTPLWTQVRRLLHAHDDPEAKEIANDVNEMLQEMRALRVDPRKHDWAPLLARQAELKARIEGSRFHDPELGKVLGLVDKRLSEGGAE